MLNRRAVGHTIRTGGESGSRRFHRPQVSPQTIYSFRGASGAHLLDLHAALPISTLVRLQRNFWSTQPVLDLANVIRPGDGATRLQLRADRGDTGNRPIPRKCLNADDEARADAVLAAHQDGLGLREQAVLMRAGQHSDQVEIELKLRNIPFVKYGGIEFINAAHVRDLLAGLRLAHNRRDEVACFRLLCRHRAIGQATARTLTAALLAAEAEDYAAVVAEAPPKARTGLQATLTHLAAAQIAVGSGAIVKHCLAAVRPLIRVHYDD